MISNKLILSSFVKSSYEQYRIFFLTVICRLISWTALINIYSSSFFYSKIWLFNFAIFRFFWVNNCICFFKHLSYVVDDGNSGFVTWPWTCKELLLRFYVRLIGALGLSRVVVDKSLLILLLMFVFFWSAISVAKKCSVYCCSNNDIDLLLLWWLLNEYYSILVSASFFLFNNYFICKLNLFCYYFCTLVSNSSDLISLSFLLIISYNLLD